LKCRLVLFLLLSQGAFCANVNIRIEPEHSYPEKKETFSVSVVADNLNGLEGAELNVLYDQDILEVKDCLPGSLFVGHLFKTETYTGSISIMAFIFPPGYPKSGTGTIAIITFLYLKEENGSITPSNVTLIPPEKNPVSTVMSGYVHPSFSRVDIRIEPKHSYPKKNEEFSISVVVDNFNSLEKVQLDLFYDQDMLKLEKCIPGPLFDGGTFNYTTSTGYVSIIGTITDPKSGTEAIITTITFLCIKEEDVSIIPSNVVLIPPDKNHVSIITPGYIHFPSTSKGIKVYPNPWRADKESKRPYIVFEVPNESNISIYAISGKLVKKFSNVISPIRWMLDDHKNEKVSSGIYIYKIKEKDGAEKIGKLGIIR